MRRSAVVVLAALVPACYHVDLAPVPPGMPAPQRVAAYQQLRVAGQNRIITVTTNAQGVTSINQTDELVLADGDSIQYGDDLLPVVAPGSAAARAGERARDARHHKYEAWAVSALSIVGGLVLAMDSIRNDSANDYMPNQNEESAGLGLMFVGGLGGAVAAWYFGWQEGRADRATFATYDDGLRAQLQLCVDGLNVVPCDQLAPQTAAP